MRSVLVVVGAVVIGYGGWLMLSTQDLAQAGAIVAWSVVAIVVHDLVLVPLVLALGWLAARCGVGDRTRSAAIAVLILMGPVSLAAVPVFLGLGADPDMPTLLGRDYRRGWIALALVVIALSTGLSALRLVSTRKRGRSTHGADPRRG
ncbi:hypothetical protein [Nocardioides humi]|uniref:Uncharacterized protein n=1 Tax=Nocardioides humi TaxID=449461 RepID=A0ABN2AKV1_9ACTN|nr:hypothetical protein [Nocardioides humi]